MEAKGKETRGADARRAGGAVPFRRAEWALDALFAAASTLVLALIGVLVGAGALPWVVPGDGADIFGEFYGSLSARGKAAFVTYMGTASLLGLVLPAAALLVWGRHDAAVRRTLAPYALVLLWQVLVEFAFARAFFPNIVIFVGLIYTAHRIRQLRRAREAFAAAREPAGLGRGAVRGLLLAGLVFWSCNLVFLLAVMLPRVTEF